MAKTGFDVVKGKRRGPKGSRQAPPKTDDVMLSEQILANFASGKRPEWIRNVLDDRLFMNNIQWDQAHIDALNARNQMAMVANFLYSAEEQAVGLLTANDPSFSVTGTEDSDTKTASYISYLMSHIWRNSHGKMLFKRVTKDYYTDGVGYVHVYWDPHADFGSGEIMLESLDTLDVFVNAATKSRLFLDADHVIIAKTVTREQVEANMPELQSLLDVATLGVAKYLPSSTRVATEGQVVSPITTLMMADTDTFEEINRYSKVKHIIFKCIDLTRSEFETICENEESFKLFTERPVILITTQQGQRYETEPVAVDELMATIQKYGPIVHYVQDPQSGQPVMASGPSTDDPSAIPGSDMQFEQLSMKELIDLGLVEVQPKVVDRIKRVYSIGGVEMYNQKLPISHYPVIPFAAIHNRNPYPNSPIRIVRPIQEYINKILSLIMAHAANSANVKVFVPRGSVSKKVMNEEFAKAGAGVIEYDAELGVPVVAAPVPLPNELYKNLADAREMIQEILGVYAFGQGDVRQSPDTFKGTVVMDEFAQRRIKTKREDIESSLTQLGIVVLEMIQKLYTKPKVFRILQPNHKPDKVSINEPVFDNVTKDFQYMLNDVTVGEYDLIVVPGSTLPSTRWGLFDYYERLVNIVGPAMIPELLKKSDIPNWEEVLERANLINQLQGQLQQAGEQIQKLQGDLQTADREAMHALKKAEMAEFKAGLDTIEGRAEAAGSVFKARLADKGKELINNNNGKE